MPTEGTNLQTTLKIEKKIHKMQAHWGSCLLPVPTQFSGCHHKDPPSPSLFFTLASPCFPFLPTLPCKQEFYGPIPTSTPCAQFPWYSFYHLLNLVTVGWCLTALKLRPWIWCTTAYAPEIMHIKYCNAPGHSSYNHLALAIKLKNYNTSASISSYRNRCFSNTKACWAESL